MVWTRRGKGQRTQWVNARVRVARTCWMRRLKVRKAVRVPTGSGSQNWMNCLKKGKTGKSRVWRILSMTPVVLLCLVQ